MQYGNPERGTRVSNISRGFKSYYVVWKPFEREKKKEFQTRGLNRTMQYGNTKTNIYPEGVAMV